MWYGWRFHRKNGLFIDTIKFWQLWNVTPANFTVIGYYENQTFHLQNQPVSTWDFCSYFHCLCWKSTTSSFLIALGQRSVIPFGSCTLASTKSGLNAHNHKIQIHKLHSQSRTFAYLTFYCLRYSSWEPVFINIVIWLVRYKFVSIILPQ